jgi:hypothetical protein
MFDTHKLNEKGFGEVQELKSKMAQAVDHAMGLMPEGREKSLFKTKIEEAMFFGTKAVASKEGNFSEIIKYSQA